MCRIISWPGVVTFWILFTLKQSQAYCLLAVASFLLYKHESDVLYKSLYLYLHIIFTAILSMVQLHFQQWHFY